jgi:hypothetical protein
VRSVAALCCLLGILYPTPTGAAQNHTGASVSAVSPALDAPLRAVTLWEATTHMLAVQTWETEIQRQERAARTSAVRRVAAPAHPAPSSSGTGGGSRQACIIARENGGSYARGTNPSHFGAYQYDRQTWAANGGNPATWGSASVAEQDAVFAATVARSGYSAWTPYDGC